MGFFGGSAWQGSESHPSRLPRCGKCGLAKGCFSPRMDPTGSGSCRVLFVAEAPGEEEDRQGAQLVGESGQKLRKTLSKLGVDLEDCTKTNAVICRPPENVVTDTHVEACRPTVLKTIKETQPSVIVLLGATACKSLLAKERGGDVGSISRWAGWRVPSREHGAWLCPTFHPAYLLRMDEDPVLERMFEDHLRRAFSLEGKKVQCASLEDLKSQIECITSTRLAKKRLKDLAKKKGVLAFDYETTGLKPEDPRQKILSVSFCLEGEDTFACLVDEGVGRLLGRVLLAPKLLKVASNLKFEERWTYRKLGLRVASWWWDTMLASHVLDNRQGITSVKFQAYVMFGVPDYDKFVDPFKECDEEGLNSFDKLDHKDLLEYNGLDSLLEYQVAMKQREMMGL